MKIQKFNWDWEVPQTLNIGSLCSTIHLGTQFENKVAMIVENDELGTSEITFKELAKKTDQFAQLLVNNEFKKEDRVLIRLPNSIDYPISFLGAMKASCISVPTSTLLTAEEVLYLAKDSQQKDSSPTKLCGKLLKPLIYQKAFITFF
jgi:acetyl-CoA synthetase